MSTAHQSATVDRADALAPASPQECLRFLKTLPSSPSKLGIALFFALFTVCLLYTSPSPRDS